MPRSRIPWSGLVWRWAVGMFLVSWRYLWQTIPLHRTEHHTDEPPTPPPLRATVDRSRLQLLGDGSGAAYHRTFSVRVRDARLDAAGLMAEVAADPGRLMPPEVVRLRRDDAPGRRLRPDDEFVVDMPGPWNGPVRVVDVDTHRLHLVTLQGHLEAGQIEFRARDEPPHLVFEIEAWAQPSGRLVDLLYGRVRLAKEIQLNMWLRACRAAAGIADGRIVDGVRIETVVGPPPRADG